MSGCCSQLVRDRFAPLDEICDIDELFEGGRLPSRQVDLGGELEVKSSDAVAVRLQQVRELRQLSLWVACPASIDNAPTPRIGRGVSQAAGQRGGGPLNDRRVSGPAGAVAGLAAQPGTAWVEGARAQRQLRSEEWYGVRAFPVAAGIDEEDDGLVSELLAGEGDRPCDDWRRSSRKPYPDVRRRGGRCGTRVR